MRYLRDHIRKVHLSKLIKCPHCELKTKRKGDLIKHIRRLHPETVQGGAGATQGQQQSAAAAQISNAQQQQQQQQHPAAVLAAAAAASSTTRPPASVLNAALGQQAAAAAASGHGHTTDALLNAAMKSEIPITLHLQYPLQQMPAQLQQLAAANQAAAAASLQPQLNMAAAQQQQLQQQQQQQPVQITLPTIDASALLNSYPGAGQAAAAAAAATPSAAAANLAAAAAAAASAAAAPSAVNAPTQQQQHSQQPQQQQPPQQQPPAYKKGHQQVLVTDPNVKCDDLVSCSYTKHTECVSFRPTDRRLCSHSPSPLLSTGCSTSRSSTPTTTRTGSAAPSATTPPTPCATCATTSARSTWPRRTSARTATSRPSAGPTWSGTSSAFTRTRSARRRPRPRSSNSSSSSRIVLPTSFPEGFLSALNFVIERTCRGLCWFFPEFKYILNRVRSDTVYTVHLLLRFCGKVGVSERTSKCPNLCLKY